MDPVLFITTSLPPRIDGVGHYTRRLADELDRRYGLRSRFFVGGDDVVPPPSNEDAVFGRGDARALAAFLDQPASLVVLSYVGYGYARKGCPFWLLDALTVWRKRRTSAKLAVFFHEVSATGKPWQSAYWLSPVQRYLARRLLELADAAVCSIEQNSAALRGDASAVAKLDRTMPVFSNCGEPRMIPPHKERESAAVVFGTPGRRTKVYENGDRLREALQDCERIYDIGPRIPVPERFMGARVIAVGEAGVEEVSAYLLQSRIGLLDYPAALLAKSGIFAAYAAHGVCCLLTGQYPGLDTPADGLKRDVHFGCGNSADTQEIGDAAWRWYQDHGVAAHAEYFSRMAGAQIPTIEVATQ